MSPPSLSWPHLTTAAVLLFVHFMSVNTAPRGHDYPMSLPPLSLSVLLCLSLFILPSVHLPPAPIYSRNWWFNEQLGHHERPRPSSASFLWMCVCDCVCEGGSSGLIQQASNFLSLLQQSRVGFICERAEVATGLIRGGSLNSASACFSVYHLRALETSIAVIFPAPFSRKANLACNK